MKEWFMGLDARERKLVSGGAVVLVLIMLYAMILDPVLSAYSELEKSVTQQQQTLSWMQQARQQVQNLKSSSGGSPAGLGGRSLLAVVDQSARSGGLGASIKRMEPDGTRGVKVWLEAASFDQMIVWLGTMSKNYRIEASSITIEPQGDGRVNVRLTLLEPGL